jgi:DNA-binding NtrC family response regulator
MANELQFSSNSVVMGRVRADIAAAARSDAAVLIEGETGVGKDVAARMIHGLGRRKSQRFVAVNCAGVPDGLLESELFGHARGSFTGAYRDKLGLAALADGGTLFLDEVGEMSPRMQAVLLRFTESGEIHPVGSDRLSHTVDVRLLAATNRSLAERIATGHFRSDLFYRLNVIRVAVPPLRERTDDVIVLLMEFVRDFAATHGTNVPQFTAPALEALTHYAWPGNVRELRNFAEQIVVQHPSAPLECADLPGHLVGTFSPAPRSIEEGISGLSFAVHGAAERAWDQMIREGKSFWTAVYDVFMDRELTKTDVRNIVRYGLQQTQGSYRQLTSLFRMTPREHRRFLAFLYQHDCQVTAGRLAGQDDGEQPLANAK